VKRPAPDRGLAERPPGAPRERLLCGAPFRDGNDRFGGLQSFNQDASGRRGCAESGQPRHRDQKGSTPCKHLYPTSTPPDRLNLRVLAMLAKFWISATARGQRGKLALKIASSHGWPCGLKSVIPSFGKTNP